MAKIVAPVKITGLRVGIPFTEGVAETSNEWLIQWFKSHGYEVIEDELPLDETPEDDSDDGTGEDDTDLDGEDETPGDPEADETPEDALPDLESFSVEELQAFAADNGIDIGRASTHEGILKKITEAGNKTD